ncbi:MAG: TolC family protein [Gemmatimonadota bacterium]
MIRGACVAVAVLLALGAPGPALAQETGLPTVSLREALRLAANLDPDYVAALRRVGDSNWVRRAAVTAFFMPEVQAQGSGTRFSTDLFNPGTNALTSQLVQASLQGQLNLFRGGSKFHDLKQSGANLESARSGELQARFQSALQTEADYYDVLAQDALSTVARERVRRADEQLQVARARVLSGAAVQTDSLQLLLELTRAQVDLLRQETALRVARLQLGRRVGMDGAVDAAPLDPLPDGDLPVSELDAVSEAGASAPSVLVARADESAAAAAHRSAIAAYLPSVDLFAQWSGFDEKFFPDATTRTSWGLSVTWPILSRGRELTRFRARTQQIVAETARQDAERQVRRDIIEAYEGYGTARATTELSERAVEVASENLRVQGERYRAGATTIIDLITAQVDLAEAESDLVQARFGARLALAAVEAILGRRLFPQ